MISAKKMAIKVRKEIKDNWSTIGNFARQNKIDPANCYRAVNSDDISPAIADILGYEKVTMFKRIEKCLD